MKIRRVLVFSLICFSICSSIWAATQQVSSLPTSSGVVLHIGDHYQELATHMGQSPNAMSSSTIIENQKNYTAMHYIYEIEGKRYTITVVNDRVRQIEWVSLNP